MQRWTTGCGVSSWMTSARLPSGVAYLHFPSCKTMAVSLAASLLPRPSCTVSVPAFYRSSHFGLIGTYLADLCSLVM